MRRVLIVVNILNDIIVQYDNNILEHKWLEGDA